MATRKSRKLWSIRGELLVKSREAMLAAVQIFNNPNVVFKSESFIVLSIIAWTYMLHANLKTKKIEYRYFEKRGKRKSFQKTKYGSFKFWELQRCLDDDSCPLDPVTKANLKFLIGLRHEIEHQMTTNLDEYLSARFQACCLNYNYFIKKLFGKAMAIDRYLSFSLQFSSISDDHAKQLKDFTDLPKNIASYINTFDDQISDADFNNPMYSYRVLYIPKITNKKGQADKVIEFIKADSPEAQGLNKEYVILKDKERPKHLAKEVILLIQAKGYKNFGISEHTKLWKSQKAQDPAKGFGIRLGVSWFWYDNWIQEVLKYCQSRRHELR